MPQGPRDRSDKFVWKAGDLRVVSPGSPPSATEISELPSRPTSGLKEIEPSTLNSKLEWQGAEFLVLAHLLIERIEAYKPYVNHAGYDLVAVNTSAQKLARISVKSRWATNRAGHFTLANLDCDFVAHVALNRGRRHKKQTLGEEIGRPVIYVFPVRVCEEVRGISGRININNIPDASRYESKWSGVKTFLQL
jgi:hypothetical protein